MGCEITIKMKDAFKTMTFKILENSSVRCDVTDPVLDEILDSCTKEFGSQPTKTTINIKVFE